MPRTFAEGISISMKKLIGALCVLTFLSGCAVRSLSIEDRKQIRTIAVLPITVSSQQFTYTGMEQAWGAGLGAGAGAATGMALGTSSLGNSALTGAGSVAGTKIADGATMSTTQAILQNMQSHDIDLGKLLRTRFEDRISREYPFAIASEGEIADAKVELFISQWGFCLKNFSTELYPVIGVVAVMKRGDKTIWQNFETISVFNDGNTKAYSPQQYVTDPEVLRSSLDHVSELVVGKLVDDLKN